ncbi:MAG TPA: TIGR03118 family protein, partial [Caldimonas sp.]|nr:TIGR03118 family protein [Caldimonas sp.]
TPGAFTDPQLPAGFAPFGIQAIGNQIIVTYAKQDAQAAKAVFGAGIGAVDVFDTAGTLTARLVAAGGMLNAPWGIALAPANFGTFSNDLLIGNLGDGRINAFDPMTGAWLGALADGNGTPIAIDGLWGIAFGNGINSQPTNTLFFAAGPNNETNGVYGRIDFH